MSSSMEARASPSIARRGSSKDLPFYEVPGDKITPARIVSEAKHAIIGKQPPALRTVTTRRPETPRDDHRKLFGEHSVRDPTDRPPSAFSLGSRHFDSESRPVSGTRLTPLDYTPKLNELESALSPKPPTDPNRRRTGSRNRTLNHSTSVDASQENATPKSASYHDNLNNVAGSAERRTGSGGTTRERRATEQDGESRRSVAESGYASDQARGGSAGSFKEGDGQTSSRGGSAQATGSAGRNRSAGSERVSSAGKPGSGGRREEETAEEAHLYNTKIGPIIDEMATHIKDKDPDRLLALSEELYSVLDSADLLGKNCKRRTLILKTVFKLLDLVSPRLLLKLARLILALKVSGNNLTNVCKLVFKVSKDEKNDVHFTEGNILDLLLETATSADHVASADALVYCVGALKFLSGTGTVIKVLVKRNCLHSMAQLLAAINKTITDAGKPQETLGHILVQLTATLRNLAEVPSRRGEFLTDRVLEELCCVMVMYFNDGDLMLNVVRIYSKLSVHNDVSVAMAEEPKYFKSFVDLLNKYKRREDIIVRVCFILGNLTARTDEARQRLFETSKAFEILLTIIKMSLSNDLHAKQQQQAPSEAGDESGRGSKTADVLIKTVRVVANLSIHADIGPRIAATDHCVVLLLQILDNPYLNGNEELILNTMATINNLSYYALKDSAIVKRQKDVADSLSKFIRKDNMELLSEATRVFGNLTRDKITRQFLYKHKLDEVMVELLNANDKEVVFTACGVLINLMADDERRSVLRKHGGIAKLIEVLKDFARTDWQLGSMACQILWNYSGKITSSNAMFGEQEAQELSDTLVDLLDEDDVLLDNDEPEDMQEFRRQVWREDFCPVAQQLLERIESHQSDFETLDHPS